MPKVWSTRENTLACQRCASAIGYASYRAWPASLNVTDVHRAPVPALRAGQLVHRLGASADPQLLRWLSLNAVENVYELDCPLHGDVITRAADITAAIRRAGPEQRWIRVPTR